MSAGQDEQRRFKRENVEVKTQLSFREESRPRAVMTLDVGPEGVQCESSEAVPQGAPVLIDLWFAPPETRIECKGKVCWSQRPREGVWQFGVRFVDLMEDEREILTRCLGSGPPIRS